MLGNLVKYCTDLSQLLDIFHMIFDANQVGITIVRADGVIMRAVPPNHLTFCPPLVISDPDLDHCVDALEKAVA